MTATSIDDIQQCLLRLDQGFSEPHSLRYINKGENQQISDDDDVENEDSDESGRRMEDGTDKNVRIIKSVFLKFWPSKESKSAWRNYVF